MTSLQSASVRTAVRIRAFTYLNAEKAALYRAIMSVFVRSARRFSFQLRPQDVLGHLHIAGLSFPNQLDVDSALEQLCEWGNLETQPDTSEVQTVEDFYKQRYVYQMTSSGEAAERAIEFFQATSHRKGELQTRGLADIRNLLLRLMQITTAETVDAAEVHRSLLALVMGFEEFVASADAFMRNLQRKVDLQAAQAEHFTSESRQLIDYLEGFISELMIARDEISQGIADLDAAGMDRLLHAAAERSMLDSPESGTEILDEALQHWRSEWNSFREWFVSQPGRPSNAEELRGKARASIATLLRVMTTVDDLRVHRIDRANDFRIMARWFAGASSDGDAHRLWRVAFGLSSSRHLTIDDTTLDQHETDDVSPTTSWLDASPLSMSSRAAGQGAWSRTTRLSRIIDRTAEKRKLAAFTHEETLRIVGAEDRFTGRRMRLSELSHLDAGEFDLFLDLLGEAVSAQYAAGEAAEIFSSDGCLRVAVEPTDDGQVAVIHTSQGLLSGPDHWISVKRVSAGEV